MSDNNKPTPIERLVAIKVLLGACLKDLVASKKDGSIPDIEQVKKTITLSKELAIQVQKSMAGNDSEINLTIEKAGMLIKESLKAISEADGNFDKVLVINLAYYLALADAAIQNVLKKLEGK
jgi:hypothetical protein